MLNDFIFHHIGVATDNIDTTAAVYIQGGYRRSKTVFDPIQNVNICWLTRNGMPTVELLAPVDEMSPVKKIIEKNGVAPYHICYIVNNIEENSQRLRQMHYILVKKAEKAIAFRGSKVAFFFNRNVGLIELVEAPAEIID